MANANPSSNRTRNPAARAPATTTSGAGHPPWAFALFPVALVALRGGGRAEVAIVALTQLNLLLLFWSARRFQSSLPGSASRGRARLVMCVLAATLTTSVTWKMWSLLMPTAALAIVAWTVVTAAIGLAYYAVSSL